MAVADLQIKTRIRSVLTKHWIDLTRIGCDCCRGSVRFRGEIALTEGHVCSSPGALLETLEAEIKDIPGVKSVYLVGVTVAADSLAAATGGSPDSSGLELTVSDLEIKTTVRAVLGRHRIDTSQIQLDCCKGTLTFRGSICFVDGTGPGNAGPAVLESLQADLKRIPGVRKVYFMGLKFARPAEPQRKLKKDSVVVNGKNIHRRS